MLLLSLSTEAILRLFRVPRVKQPTVTVEEIKVLFEQGAEEGVFEPSEHDLLRFGCSSAACGVRK